MKILIVEDETEVKKTTRNEEPEPSTTLNTMI